MYIYIYVCIFLLYAYFSIKDVMLHMASATRDDEVADLNLISNSSCMSSIGSPRLVISECIPEKDDNDKINFKQLEQTESSQMGPCDEKLNPEPVLVFFCFYTFQVCCWQRNHFRQTPLIVKTL